MNQQTVDRVDDRPSRLTGGELVVRTLRELGVRHVFGIPGGQTLAITDALIDAPDIDFVTARHESAAASMADAVGRLTGRPGVCLATTGPGATNLLTGVGGAFRDSSPVLVLTCNNRLSDLDRDDAQAANHVDIFRSLTKWATLVTQPRDIPRVLSEAALRSTGSCPGPVLIDFARDALEATIEMDASETFHAPNAVVTAHRAFGDPERVQRALEMVLDAERPILWAGNGVEISGANQDALALAERLDLPVITTFNALGAFKSDHPNVFGPLSRMGTEVSFRVLAEADLVLAVGNSLNAVSTGRWSLRVPQHIVQIDNDTSYLARNYPERTFGVLGDARSVLRQMISELDDAAPAVERLQQARKNWVAELSEAKRGWWDQATSHDPGGVITPHGLVQIVREQTPDDTVLIVDAGNPGVWTHLWRVREPGTYLKPVGFGNMGFALPAAIGAKIDDPSRPVVALIGDGSLGMTLGELETVVRERIAPCLVIMNDGGYGNIRQEQLVRYGERNIGVDFGPADYAAVARAFGMWATTANDPESLRTAIAKVLASGEAGLIDARIDPTVNAWTFPLFQQYDLEA